MINVDSNSLYRIDLSAADQPGTARLDSVSLPLAPSRRVEVRTNRPLTKSRVATVQASVESLPPASQLVAQEELNAFRRLQDAKEKVERFHKATSDRVKRRKELEKNRQREELLAKAKKLNAVRAYCVANRIGACLEEEKQPERPQIQRELNVRPNEIKEVAEEDSREEELVIGDSDDEERQHSPDGLRAFSQTDYNAPEELPAKRTFKADFAAFGSGKSQSPKPKPDTQTPKLDKPQPVALKSVTFTAAPSTSPGQTKVPAKSATVLPKGKVILPPQPPELVKPRRLTRKEEQELANRLMKTGTNRSKSESQTQIYDSEEPLPTPAAIVLYNAAKALEVLGGQIKAKSSKEQLVQSQTKATAKLHLTGLHSNIPRKWGQNEFDDLALQIAMVREIASIQEAGTTRPRSKSTEPKVPWGTPAVPTDANRVKRVRVEALTLERGSVAQRRKSPHSPVQAYSRPLTAAETRPSRSPERAKSAGKRSSASPPTSPFALTPRKGATLDSIEAAFKRKFKSAMRFIKHLPQEQKKSRMKDLKEQYETALEEAKEKYLASLPPKTVGERHIELIRYSAALKALVKDRLKERYTEDIPAVCTCGALSTKRDPRKPVQCANNCPFYQRQQEYQKAVAEVLHTFNAV